MKLHISLSGVFASIVLGTFALIFPAEVLAQNCPTAQEIRQSLKTTYVDGILVIGEASPNAKVFMRLAAFAASPSMVDEPRLSNHVSYTKALALDILRPRTSAFEYFFSSKGFDGATQEEVEASEKTFLNVCSAAMLELAPKAPFRIMIADQAPLGLYDEKRGALTIPRGPNYLAPTHYTDFLHPKSDEPLRKTDRYWSMSRSEADALYARLKARSSSPAEARTLQAVAVVDVLKIDPEFRTASLKFVEFALYNHDFSEKIYDYGAVPAARGDAKKPLADTESKAVPLPEGRFATGPEAEARALQLCMGSTRTATRLKCDCVARKVAAAWENNREKHIYTLLNDAVIAGEYECENPDAMYESYVDNCKRMYASQEFVARLGEEKACKCIAERSMELDPVNALAFCMLVEDYPP